MSTQLDPRTGERGYYSPITAHSVALTNAFVAKAGDGIAFGFEVYNSLAALQFVLRFDANTPPANGAIPDMIYPIAASSTLAVDFKGGLPFYAGFVLCCSTTDTTLTLGAANCWVSTRVL